MTRDLSTSDQAVLAALGAGPAHGFRLAALFAKSGELGTVWAVQRPQVYRALEHLVAAGLAEAVGQEPGEGGPPRLLYQLTGAGLERLNTWFITPVAHLRDARSDLLLKLVFLERQGRDPEPLLSAQRRHFEHVRDTYRVQRDKTEGAQRLALEWRVSAAEAALQFLEQRF